MNIDDDFYYHKLLVEHISNKVKSDFNNEMFVLEYINPLQFLSENDKITEIDKLKSHYFKTLNKGYPFVAYHFTQGTNFDEENFFEGLFTEPELFDENLFCTSIKQLEKLSRIVDKYPNNKYKDSEKFLFEVLKDTNRTYTQAKRFEYLLKYRVSLLNQIPEFKEEENNSFVFQNKFDEVKPNRVYQYFHTELVLKGYMELEDLILFLVDAFQDCKEPKEKYRIKTNRINIITNIFYKYYREVAEKPFGKKKQYAGLLGNYFFGYTAQKTDNNFARYYGIIK